ncbi:unnamed protein product [Bursaphelenchus okinawaensis]|uniref:F-box domain-containing protein n=1 Tax=Bursaphelenchus okinawaensis TaxID=465554 RepID=A0A811KRQ9_9BILA|nr:unnamed protein product [Bursaphelenchus okinawaensis]CAG9111947.1 unnamed protein product [Bursaphelenchus okinawaensis]
MANQELPRPNVVPAQVPNPNQGAPNPEPNNKIAETVLSKIDILEEICLYLSIKDLISLSMVSKRIDSTFLSSDVAIWKPKLATLEKKDIDDVVQQPTRSFRLEVERAYRLQRHFFAALDPNP